MKSWPCSRSFHFSLLLVFPHFYISVIIQVTDAKYHKFKENLQNKLLIILQNLAQN